MSTTSSPPELASVVAILTGDEYDAPPQTRLHMAENALEGTAYSLEEAVAALAISESGPLGLLIGDIRELVTTFCKSHSDLALDEIEQSYGFVATEEDLYTVAAHMTARNDLLSDEKERRLKVLYGAASAYLDFEVDPIEFNETVKARAADPPDWDDLPELVRIGEIKDRPIFNATAASDDVKQLLEIHPDYSVGSSEETGPASDDSSKSGSQRQLAESDTEPVAEVDDPDADDVDDSDDLEGEWDSSIVVDPATVDTWGCPVCSYTNESLHSVLAHMSGSKGKHEGESQYNWSIHLPGYTDIGSLKWAQPRFEDADKGTVVPADLVTPDHWATESQREAARVDVPLETMHSSDIVDPQPDTEKILDSAEQEAQTDRNEQVDEEDKESDPAETSAAGADQPDGDGGTNRASSSEQSADQHSDEEPPVEESAEEYVAEDDSVGEHPNTPEDADSDSSGRSDSSETATAVTADVKSGATADSDSSREEEVRSSSPSDQSGQSPFEAAESEFPDQETLSEAVDIEISSPGEPDPDDPASGLDSTKSQEAATSGQQEDGSTETADEPIRSSGTSQSEVGGENIDQAASGSEGSPEIDGSVSAETTVEPEVQAQKTDEADRSQMDTKEEEAVPSRVDDTVAAEHQNSSDPHEPAQKNSPPATVGPSRPPNNGAASDPELGDAAEMAGDAFSGLFEEGEDVSGASPSTRAAEVDSSSEMPSETRASASDSSGSSSGSDPTPAPDSAADSDVDSDSAADADSSPDPGDLDIEGSLLPDEPRVSSSESSSGANRSSQDSDAAPTPESHDSTADTADAMPDSDLDENTDESIPDNSPTEPAEAETANRTAGNQSDTSTAQNSQGEINTTRLDQQGNSSSEVEGAEESSSPSESEGRSKGCSQSISAPNGVSPERHNEPSDPVDDRGEEGVETPNPSDSLQASSSETPADSEQSDSTEERAHDRESQSDPVDETADPLDPDHSERRADTGERSKTQEVEGGSRDAATGSDRSLVGRIKDTLSGFGVGGGSDGDSMDDDTAGAVSENQTRSSPDEKDSPGTHEGDEAPTQQDQSQQERSDEGQSQASGQSDSESTDTRKQDMSDSNIHESERGTDTGENEGGIVADQDTTEVRTSSTEVAQEGPKQSSTETGTEGPATHNTDDQDERSDFQWVSVPEQDSGALEADDREPGDEEQSHAQEGESSADSEPSAQDASPVADVVSETDQSEDSSERTDITAASDDTVDSGSASAPAEPQQEDAEATSGADTTEDRTSVGDQAEVDDESDIDIERVPPTIIFEAGVDGVELTEEVGVKISPVSTREDVLERAVEIDQSEKIPHKNKDTLLKDLIVSVTIPVKPAAIKEAIQTARQTTHEQSSDRNRGRVDRADESTDSAGRRTQSFETESKDESEQSAGENEEQIDVTQEVQVTSNGAIETPVKTIADPDPGEISDVAVSIYTDLDRPTEEKYALVEELATVAQTKARLGPVVVDDLLDLVDQSIEGSPVPGDTQGEGTGDAERNGGDDDDRENRDSDHDSAPELESRDDVVEMGVSIATGGLPDEEKKKQLASLVEDAQAAGIEIDEADLALEISTRRTNDS